jgi:hypothetical protein
MRVSKEGVGHTLIHTPNKKCGDSGSSLCGIISSRFRSPLNEKDLGLRNYNLLNVNAINPNNV